MLNYENQPNTVEDVELYMKILFKDTYFSVFEITKRYISQFQQIDSFIPNDLLFNNVNREYSCQIIYKPSLFNLTAGDYIFGALLYRYKNKSPISSEIIHNFIQISTTNETIENNTIEFLKHSNNIKKLSLQPTDIPNEDEGNIIEEAFKILFPLPLEYTGGNILFEFTGNHAFKKSGIQSVSIQEDFYINKIL